MKRVLASILCAAVTISSGSFSPSVMAAETREVSSGEGESLQGDDSGKESESDETDSDEEVAEDGTVKDAAEGGTGKEPGDVPESEDEDMAEAELLSADEAEGSADGELTEKTGNSSKAGTEKLPEGINGMPDGYKLSSDERRMKRNAASHDALDAMEELDEGSDYVAGEVICLADSREEAERVAYAYSGELLEYSYGVATISLKESPLSVREAFEYSLDENLELPFVEPNYITEIEKPEVVSEEEAAETFSLGEDEVYTGNGFSDRWWTDWLDSENLRDPYINPENDVFQWHHQMVGSYSAWGVTMGSSDVTVAVIDSGVNAEHEDLKNNVITENVPNFYEGEVDAPGYQDADHHGTHVAGIIAAEMNGSLGAGIAPNVKILPLRVANKKNVFTDAVIISAILYAAGYDDDSKSEKIRADIINMSLGGPCYSASEQEAVNRAHDAGVTVVVSMGNDDQSNLINYPACYDNVIAVCSVNESGDLSPFSSVGSWADVSAPGSNIYSTYSEDKDGNGRLDDYVYLDGTSMAAPVISGACALYMSAVGHVDPDTMESVIKSSVSGYAGEGTGSGIIDLVKMFDGDITGPEISVNAGDNTLIGKARDGENLSISYSVSPSSTVTIKPLTFKGDESGNANTSIIYTTDGTTPYVSGGKIENGKKYTDPLEIGTIVGDTDETKSVTIKAMAVTGMGIAGRVSTLTFDVDPELESKESIGKYSIEILNNPGHLSAGKSLKLEALVTSDDPDEEVSQNVRWRIEDYKGGSLSFATIDGKTGLLKTDALQTGTLIISCTSENSLATKEIEIEVVDRSPVGQMVINSGKNVDLEFDETGVAASKIISLTTLTDSSSKKNDLLKDDSWKDYEFLWTSSNTDVLELDQPKGNISAPSVELFARGQGKSVLTCKALDGSGKSTKITVNVSSKVAVTDIAVYEKTGDGEEKVSSKTLYSDSGSFEVYAKYTLPEGTDAGSYKVIAPIWSSSNSKVARVEVLSDNALGAVITPLSKGSANITCAAMDGSGKKAVLKITVLQRAKEISVSGQKYIAPGASAKYTAKVLPENADDKNVVWSIDPATEGVSVTKGVVKVDKSADPSKTGAFKVVAALSDGTKGSVEVRVMDKAAGVSIEVLDGTGAASKKKYKNEIATAPLGEYLDYTYVTSRAFDSSKNDLGSEVSFSSSNEKVATVEATGDKNVAFVRAVAKGTCYITATAQDGSKKSAKIKITVKQPVDSISVTGQGNIAVGNKATFKAAVYPNAASNRKVTWAVYAANEKGEPDFDKENPTGVTVSSRGVVSVDKASPIKKDVAVVASASDGSGTYGYITFTVSKAKVSGVGIEADESFVIEKVHNITKKSDSVSALRLYDTNLPDPDTENGAASEPKDERKIRLTCFFANGQDLSDVPVEVEWVSSNDRVVSVSVNEDGSAILTGLKPGSATVTCYALDGSGKKTSVKVTVITPASGIEITSAAGIMSFSEGASSVIAMGKSVVPNAVLGNVYGKPTITKVKWDYEVGYYKEKSEDDDTYVFEALSDGAAKIIKDKKLFFSFSSSNGKLTVKSKKQVDKDIDIFNGLSSEKLSDLDYLSVNVKASTTDGTERSASEVIEMISPTTYIKVDHDEKNSKVIELTLAECRSEDGSMGGMTYIIDSDSTYGTFKVTSSDVNVASAYAKLSEEKVDGEKKYVRRLVIYPNRTGRTKITIQALDGTNVKATYTVDVSEGAADDALSGS
ncbi:MAG: S8 family serine peptidase [Butyrivibrio sp.]|nr:S8 family serine peptidase [Butyrivibrio sp.]